MLRLLCVLRLLIPIAGAVRKVTVLWAVVHYTIPNVYVQLEYVRKETVLQAVVYGTTPLHIYVGGEYPSPT